MVRACLSCAEAINSKFKLLEAFVEQLLLPGMISIQISLLGSKETQDCQHLLCVGTSQYGDGWTQRRGVIRTQEHGITAPSGKPLTAA